MKIMMPLTFLTLLMLSGVINAAQKVDDAEPRAGETIEVTGHWTDLDEARYQFMMDELERTYYNSSGSIQQNALDGMQITRDMINDCFAEKDAGLVNCETETAKSIRDATYYCGVGATILGYGTANPLILGVLGYMCYYSGEVDTDRIPRTCKTARLEARDECFIN